MTTVVAFDIATRVGVAFGAAGETPRAVSVDLGKGRSEGARFARLLRLTRETLERFTPDIVVFEAPVGGPRTSHLLVGLAACFVGQAHDMGHQPLKLNLQAVRKHFLGRVPVVKDFPGLRSDKAKVEIKRLVIARCHELGWAPNDGDQADAMALFAYASVSRAKVTLPPPGGLF